MKALISPNELREDGYRVAQVEQDLNTFQVASPMFWVDCDENVVADYFWYDPATQLINSISVPEPVQVQDQPTVQGAQTL